jgi:hypothetical protein
MPWQAKPGCAEHHRAAVERIVNTLPPSWLLKPSSGEIHDSLEGCNRRLRGYALAEGFDIGMTRAAHLLALSHRGPFRLFGYGVLGGKYQGRNFGTQFRPGATSDLGFP